MQPDSVGVNTPETIPPTIIMGRNTAMENLRKITIIIIKDFQSILPAFAPLSLL